MSEGLPAAVPASWMSPLCPAPHTPAKGRRWCRGEAATGDDALPLADAIRRVFLAKGLTPAEVEAGIVELRTTHGGQRHYLRARSSRKDLAVRDAEICRAATSGATVPALAEAFDLRRSRVYEILRRGGVHLAPETQTADGGTPDAA